MLFRSDLSNFERSHLYLESKKNQNREQTGVCPGARCGEIGESGQGVQTSSYKVNNMTTIVNNTILYFFKLQRE